MSGLDFASYFRGVHGVSPFPWQERLVEHLLTHHSWPSLIDLPTASGKTACIDIALFHVASCIEAGEPSRAARRIFFVVDRRIIVDAAAERAERIRAALDSPSTEGVDAVASALKRLGLERPLMCHKLRGGMPRERGFASDPTQPMVVTSTVDQVGSRLLFRGYGLSPYAWPMHAGLLAFDTLILLDEAHLSGPFMKTVAALQREQSRAERRITSAPPLCIVPMSATTHASGDRFQLDERDFKHPLIADRHTAPKPIKLLEVTGKSTERLKVLLRETLTAHAEIEKPASPAIAVIVNRVKTARALFEQLRGESSKKGFSVELLTGRSRPLDRDSVAQRVVERAGAGRRLQPTERGLIVVATQAIEVGADLDFQAMITECAALDALRQRFGRLDRLGRFRRARGVIVGGGDSEDDPVYGAALNATWRWLMNTATRHGEEPSVDFSIEKLGRQLEGVDIRGMVTPDRPTTQFTPLQAELLAQTSPRPMYEPEIAPLLHGLDSSPPDVQVVWRDDLPVSTSGERTAFDGRERRTACDLLELNPPSSLEALALPLSVVRAWLDCSKDKSSLSDLEGSPAGAPDDNSGTSLRRVLTRRSGQWDAVFARDIRPGETIVVPSAYGGCDEHGFSADIETPVSDLSAPARKRMARSPLLVLTAQAIASMADGDTAATDAWRQAAGSHQLEAFDPGEQAELLIDLLDEHFREERPWLSQGTSAETVLDRQDELYAIVVTGACAQEGDISDEDISSSRTVPVGLAAHNAGVGRRARELASTAGLNREVIETLACAGELHDIGKADPRFQQVLRAGDSSALPGELLAKGLRTASGGQAKLGERHEAYSVALLKKNPQLLVSASDPDLALYLIGVHHGRGRPLMPDQQDEGVEFDLDLKGQRYVFEGSPELGYLGSGWAQLFWKLSRRYGLWGLAYLEAVLRLADWLRSAEELRSGGRQ